MKGILIATHYTLAKALVETSEMLVGKHDFIDYACLMPGCSPDDFREEVSTKIDALNAKGYDEIILMVDMFGGTPCNQSVMLLRDKKIRIISGVNLPLLYQTILQIEDETPAADMVANLVEDARETITDVNKIFNM